jgi:hypothetical protein
MYQISARSHWIYRRARAPEQLSNVSSSAPNQCGVTRPKFSTKEQEFRVLETRVSKHMDRSLLKASAHPKSKKRSPRRQGSWLQNFSSYNTT